MALDPTLGDELLVTGRAALQVLAQVAQGHRWTPPVPLVAAPYGVLSAPALWTPAA